jgi:hypothetical protein
VSDPADFMNPAACGRSLSCVTFGSRPGDTVSSTASLRTVRTTDSSAPHTSIPGLEMSFIPYPGQGAAARRDQRPSRGDPGDIKRAPWSLTTIRLWSRAFGRFLRLPGREVSCRFIAVPVADRRPVGRGPAAPSGGSPERGVCFAHLGHLVTRPGRRRRRSGSGPRASWAHARRVALRGVSAALVVSRGAVL